MKVDNFEYLLVNDGTFKLDGGAMFGVVPKPVWQKYFISDEQNRITLGTNTLVIRSGKKIALVDLGMGDKYDQKLLSIYDIKREKNTIQRLEDLHIKTEDVTHVIFTHGHLDHTGWSTVNRNGLLVPTFPNAKYFLQDDTWDEIRNANEKTKPNYNFQNFVNLDNNLEIISGDEEVFPGVQLVKTGGHTKGHQIVISRVVNNTFVYFGDLIPTSAHIKPAYIMGYDLYPMDTFSQKKKLLEEAYEEQWNIIFEHDPNMPSAKLKDVERYSLERITV